MFIETEGTPNPATLKFLPGRDVMGAGTADFASPEAAARSPLAARCSRCPASRACSSAATSSPSPRPTSTRWQALKPQVLGAIMEHFVAGRPVIEGADDDAPDEDVAPEDREIVAQIKELLDTRVRPAVAGDGGDIVFRGYRDGMVRLHMQGACSRLPVVQRDAEARHREHAAALRAGSASRSSRSPSDGGACQPDAAGS